MATTEPQAVIYPKRAAFAQPFDRRVQLMQDLLEPKLVSLVDDNEQKLIVTLRVGKPFLKSDQLRHFEIFVV